MYSRFRGESLALAQVELVPDVTFHPLQEADEVTPGQL